MSWKACAGFLIHERAARAEPVHRLCAGVAAAGRPAHAVVDQIASLLRGDLFEPLLPAAGGRKLAAIGASEDVLTNGREREKSHGCAAPRSRR